jgi:predicted TIM-barrel fold metal-dependent hydrolase
MIDCHTHVFPPKIGPKLAAAIGREFGREPAGDGSPVNLFLHLDQAGLKKAVCFTAALRPDQMIPANSWMIGLGRTHSRLLPLGTVHPEHHAWRDELERLERNNIRGLKIHPDLTGIPLDSPIWEPVWEATRGRFMIMLHMGPSRPGGRTVSRPVHLAGILDRHADLTVVAAHLGGLGLWTESLEHLAGRDVFMDTSCCHDAIAPETFAAILKRHDPRRILFGSDYPLFAPESERAALARLLADAHVRKDALLANGDHLAGILQPVGFAGRQPAAAIDIS